jgi:predicted HAD superfamily Cof-like phosphohydrolase
MKTINNVEEFMFAFKQTINQTPTMLTGKDGELRGNLIAEEAKELQKAIEEGDMVGVLDALVDLQYVLDGAVLAFGLKNIFPEAFKEVHRSNMSKACKDEREAMDTIDHHTDEHGTCRYETLPNGMIGVYRESDNKLLKNKYYSPANLEKFIK